MMPRPNSLLAEIADRAGAEVVAPGLLRLALATPTLPPATTTNHYIVGMARALLVDPSAPARLDQDRLATLLQLLSDDLGYRFQALLLTHHHRDHVGAATVLAARLSLPIWAHAATADRLAGEIDVDHRIEDQDIVAEDAGGSWRAVHTPGHAPGHLVLWHEGDRGMVAGDMVAGEGTILIDPRDGHMGQYLASLQRMTDLRPTYLAPAHGPVLRDAAQVLAFYREHRMAREARILAALPREWTKPEDLLATAYADVSRLVWAIALRSMLAHLQHLAEGGAAEPRAGWWRRLG
jgi:glyoxylase-like metal-dependent hydrolase (beta-lactamase superfamily II)